MTKGRHKAEKGQFIIATVPMVTDNSEAALLTVYTATRCVETAQRHNQQQPYTQRRRLTCFRTKQTIKFSKNAVLDRALRTRSGHVSLVDEVHQFTEWETVQSWWTNDHEKNINGLREVWHHPVSEPLGQELQYGSWSDWTWIKKKNNLKEIWDRAAIIPQIEPT